MSWLRVPNSIPCNAGSQIQNPKRLGLLALVFVFMVSVDVGRAQPTPIHRIGFLAGASPAAIPERVEAFRQGLRALGYVEGKNIVIEFRWAGGKRARLPALAAELVDRKVDVIVTVGQGSLKDSAKVAVIQGTN